MFEGNREQPLRLSETVSETVSLDSAVRLKLLVPELGGSF